MIFVIRQHRGGKIISRRCAHNLITVEGLNALAADVLFALSSNTIFFIYCGLISSGSVLASDTQAVKSFTEFTDYTRNGGSPFKPTITSQGALLTPGSGIRGFRTSTNSAVNDEGFLITSAGTVTGAFLTDDQVIGGTSGELWGGASFPGISVQPGDILTAEYTRTIQANDTIGAP